MEKIIRSKTIRWIYYFLSVLLFLNLLDFVSSAFSAIHDYNAVRELLIARGHRYSLIDVISNLLSPLTMLITLYLLRGIFYSALRDRVFEKLTIARIRWVGYIYLIYAGVRIIISLAIQMTSLGSPGFLGYFSDIFFAIWNMAQSVTYGLIIFALAEVFRYGLMLKLEQELTI